MYQGFCLRSFTGESFNFLIKNFTRLQKTVATLMKPLDYSKSPSSLFKPATTGVHKKKDLHEVIWSIPQLLQGWNIWLQLPTLDEGLYPVGVYNKRKTRSHVTVKKGEEKRW